MKRALALCTVLAVLGFSAFGIGTFSGKWETRITLIAPVGLDYTKLTLNYTDFGWTFTGLFSFGSSGLDLVKITAKGAAGPLSITGNAWFDAAPTPAWMGGDLATTLDFAGLALGLTVRHWDKDYAGDFFSATDPTKYWYPDTEPCQTYADQAGMMYILTAKVDPISLKVRFVDCSWGIEFYDASVSLTGLGLCCGITYDASLSINKESGFESLTFTVKDIFSICCGISFDASVTFTTSGKTIDLKAKFAGFADACFTVFADLIKDGGSNSDLYIRGLRVDGWKIKCSLGDCNYVEFVSFLSPDNADLYGYPEGTFEIFTLGFCGPGCCGGQYTVKLGIEFQPSGALFGIKKLSADMSIPIMTNFTITVKFTSTPSLKVGWVFTF